MRSPMGWRLSGDPLSVSSVTVRSLQDESIDEDGLRVLHLRELALIEGIKGVTCNGHTGEIMSLRPAERVPSHVNRS